MNRYTKFAFTAFAAFCLCAGSATAWSAEKQARENTMTNVEKVAQFLQETQFYFIATVDGDQPRVRPFGTAQVIEGRLYIQTGKKKKVARQIAANPKVELCALKDVNGSREWLRVSGTLVNDDRREIKIAMLDAYPSLKKMYSPDDDNTQVLYFKDATATFFSFAAEPVTFSF